MNNPPNKVTDQILLDAFVAFVTTHTHPDVLRFRPVILEWGHGWADVEPVHLPASDTFAQALSLADAQTATILGLFVQHRATLRWEQSYSKADRAVSVEMLSNYGYAEIVGKNGPFFSARVRAGVAVYGPHLVYPPHRHQAEEIYAVLAGTATCQIENEEPATRGPGDILYHAPQVRHGLQTGEHPLAIAYLWQAGDLREKPSFE